jgi:hypothetical protein
MGPRLICRGKGSERDHGDDHDSELQWGRD